MLCLRLFVDRRKGDRKRISRCHRAQGRDEMDLRDREWMDRMDMTMFWSYDEQGD